jgi:ABC-type glutathione transport system ATPase component
MYGIDGHFDDDLSELEGVVDFKKIDAATLDLVSLSNRIHNKVVNAAMAANAHGFVSNFPQGYDTFIGEGGRALSGGQKQRLAIARAIVKDPALLLLDEATSALDNRNEKIIRDSLERLRTSNQKLTTICVAHRLSTIRHANRIIMIQGGQVVEMGTHNELMARQTAYYQLVREQVDCTDFLSEGIAENSTIKQDILVSDAVEHRVERVLSFTTLDEDFSGGSLREESTISRLETFCSYVSEGDDESLVDKQVAIYERMKPMICERSMQLIAACIGSAVYGSIFPCMS